MLKNLFKAIPLVQAHCNLLNPLNIVQQQLRTTYILKRKYTAPLSKTGVPMKRLRPKYYIYELIKDTSTEEVPPLDLILMHYVEGLGNTGDKVSVKAHYGYNQLLLPGLAIYATPENIEKYKDYESSKDEIKHSSPTAQLTVASLERMSLSVVMNRDNPWTLQPWHIRSSFRKCGYVVPDEAITLPEKPIKGPDMNLQNREFYITVTVNNLEKAKVRCRIHHWSTVITERIPHVNEFWNECPGPIFPEDAPILDAMPKKVTRKKLN